jgi:hypothetical protein
MLTGMRTAGTSGFSWRIEGHVRWSEDEWCVCHYCLPIFEARPMVCVYVCDCVCARERERACDCVNDGCNGLRENHSSR